MPKFKVIKDTIDSATGRQYKARDIAEMELPMFVKRDVEGNAIPGVDPVPMKVGSNLQLIEDIPEAKKAK